MMTILEILQYLWDQYDSANKQWLRTKDRVALGQMNSARSLFNHICGRWPGSVSREGINTILERIDNCICVYCGDPDCPGGDC